MHEHLTQGDLYALWQIGYKILLQKINVTHLLKIFLTSYLKPTVPNYFTKKRQCQAFLTYNLPGIITIDNSNCINE